MSEPNAASQAPSTPPPGGSQPPLVGDFELLERIGQGAMGTVYKARQRSMDRLVAVKVLHPRLAADAAYVERFFREARAAARLSHPNIVLALTVGEDNGYFYFAMEYIEGHTVSLLLKPGPLEERRALEVTLQVARALDYAWSQERIVHRDIKPGNILITPDGTAKLADLGLAYEATLEDQSAAAPDGKILGTPCYMAPEQILRRADLDVRCDLYGLGATLYHMVTGRPPYEGQSSKAILTKQLHEPAPDPLALRPELSPNTARIIRKLMAKDRDDRYEDAKALAADLEAALRGHAPAPRHVPAPRVRRLPPRQQSLAGPLILTLAIILAIIALAIVAISSLRPRDAPRRTDGPGKERVVPPLPPPPTPAHEAAAELAWKDALAFAEANPTDPAGVLGRLRDIERRFRGTTWAAEAARRRAALEADLEAKGKEALRDLVGSAEALVAEGRHADALALFDKPPALAAPDWPERLAAARSALERKAREAFNAAIAQADAQAAKGDFDAAVKAYEAAAVTAPAAWAGEAVAKVAEARRRQTEAAERAQARREATLLRTLAEAARLYRERRYGEAAAMLKERGDAAAPDLRDDLARELAEAQKLLEFWSRAQQGANRFIGRQFTIRGISGELVSIQNGRLTIRSPGGSFSEEMRNLATDQILSLALPEYTVLDAPLAAARFLLAEGRAADAAARLKAARGNEAEAAALAARAQRFEAAARLAAAGRELQDARKLLAAGDHDGAETALRAFLERHAALPAAASLRDEAQRLLKEAIPPKPTRWGYVGGRAAAQPEADVRNTRDKAIYQTRRHGLQAYRIPIPNGNYLVRLHFAETYPSVTAVGQRVFSVTIEGRPALTDFDVIREANRQRLTAINMEFDVEVTDGELTIEFTSKATGAFVSGIEVLRRGRRRTRDILLINCGATEDYRDHEGRTWARDQAYQGQ